MNIWSWAGISFAEDVEVTSEFGWNHDLAVMKAVDGNENWYSVTIKILDAEADDGFTIYQNGTGDDNILVQYDSQYNNQSDYANFVSGTESAYAVKDETVYTNLSEAGLNMEDQADDDDNSTEYNLQITADNTTVEARVLKGFREAHKLIGQNKPDVIFSKGGFVSVPFVLAGKRCKVRFFLFI